MTSKHCKLYTHFFFWLKNAGSFTGRQQLMGGLQTLATIKGVKQLIVGTPAATEQRGVVDSSYDVSELMYFDSLAAHAFYQEHPIHKAFIEKYSTLWDKVIVYDVLVA